MIGQLYQSLYMSTQNEYIVFYFQAAKRRQSCVVEKCLCPTPDVLDCSGKKLQYFNTVNSATGEIKVLKLSRNNLKDVPDLSLFTKLHTLDLSYNNITSLPVGVFQSVPLLVDLDISFNNLVLSGKTVTVESFQGLTNLKTLR